QQGGGPHCRRHLAHDRRLRRGESWRGDHGHREVRHQAGWQDLSAVPGVRLDRGDTAQGNEGLRLRRRGGGREMEERPGPEERLALNRRVQTAMLSRRCSTYAPERYAVFVAARLSLPDDVIGRPGRRGISTMRPS